MAEEDPEFTYNKIRVRGVTYIRTVSGSTHWWLRRRGWDGPMIPVSAGENRLLDELSAPPGPTKTVTVEGVTWRRGPEAAAWVQAGGRTSSAEMTCALDRIWQLEKTLPGVVS
jgi:hypothetical protein